MITDYWTVLCRAFAQCGVVCLLATEGTLSYAATWTRQLGARNFIIVAPVLCGRTCATPCWSDTSIQACPRFGGEQVQQSARFAFCWGPQLGVQGLRSKCVVQGQHCRLDSGVQKPSPSIPSRPLPLLPSRPRNTLSFFPMTTPPYIDSLLP